jgi:Ca2+-binding RTX toxin-like protein
LVSIENLTGSSYADRLTGNSADNVLTGLDGNDTLNGGAGDDTMVGGLGNDVYRVDSAGDAIIENFGEGIDSVLSSSTYTLSANIEKLTLTGSSASWGYGNDIANTLTGNSADNKLFGFEGNDTLNGKAGDDTMVGGLGNDKYYVDSTSDRIIEQADEGTDSVLATASYRLSGDVERLTLTGTGDTYGYGNGIGNVLTGNSGANQLSGLGGNDLINGSGGDDSLFGGSGADQLKGGEGSDWIEGGAERDLLYGNSGADVFVFRDGDFGHTQSTADRIMDFHSDQADSIDLHVVDANILLDGNQAFSFIGTNAFSHTAGELRYVEAGAATFVCGDMDGDGISDLMIRLDGSHSLSVGDFVL